MRLWLSKLLHVLTTTNTSAAAAMTKAKAKHRRRIIVPAYDFRTVQDSVLTRLQMLKKAKKLQRVNLRTFSHPENKVELGGFSKTTLKPACYGRGLTLACCVKSPLRTYLTFTPASEHSHVLVVAPACQVRSRLELGLVKLGRVGGACVSLRERRAARVRGARRGDLRHRSDVLQPREHTSPLPPTAPCCADPLSRYAR